MSTQQSYAMFYKDHGVRYLTHLKTPRLMEYSELVLPRRSIVHWIDYEGLYKVGPPESEPLLVQEGNKLYVEAVSKYPDDTVKPGFILVKNNTHGLLVKYDGENPNIKRMTKVVDAYVSADATPLYAYSLLHETYKYKTYIDSPLNRWMNHYYTVMQTALEVSGTSDRQQFIELDVPKHFPSIQNLKKGEGGITKANIRYLPTADFWIITCFWNLIAGNGNDFIFKNYSLEDFDKINIIWRVGSQYMLTNLGVMLGFAHGEQASTTPIKLQRMLIQSFIKLNLTLSTLEDGKKELDDDVDSFSGTKPEDDYNDGDDIGDPEEDNDLNEGEGDDLYNGEEEDDSSIFNPFKADERIKKDKIQQADLTDNFQANKNVVLDDDDGSEADDDEEDIEFAKLLDAVADEDTAVNTGYNAYESKPVTGSRVIAEEGARLVKAGIMSPGSFERIQRLSEKSGDIADPVDPSINISESMIITKEDITVEDKTPLNVESKDFEDESMKYSSLNKFNKQYIEKVHHKDVLNSVMAIQKGGVVVKDYSIEKVESVNEKYNVHKVQIETLRGHVSTLSFKVPVIESDGTFKSSGSKRYMRKQRGDKI